MPAYQRILRSFGAYDVVSFQTETGADNFRDCIVAAKAGRVWAGYAIADALDLDASDTVQKERVKRMLDAWIETGALKVSREPSPKNKSRMRPTVIVGSRTVEGGT